MRTILVGGQYGDEGKGKIAGYIAMKDRPKIVVRGGVGPNAGHKVVYKGKTYGMRQLPSGFVYEKAKIMVGAGVLVDPDVFLKEVEMINAKNRAFVDFRCTVIEQKHKEEDAGAVGQKIGTTKTGCGPAWSERARRTAKLAQDEPKLKPFLTDVAKAVNDEKNVLIEGSQGFMLSVLYGTYPYVTSKDTSASSIAADVGLGPKSIDNVIMVIKSYTTRVGNGPLKNEISMEEAEKFGIQEYGTVTGRPRRTSLDLHWDDLRTAAEINSATYLAVTKVDVRFGGNRGVRKYPQLTKEARRFIEDIEKKVGVPVGLIGTGPDIFDVIDRREEVA